MKVFFDTSVLVASVVGEHPGHARAVGVARRAAAGQDQGYVAARGLAEAYAVLTTHRIYTFNLAHFRRLAPATLAARVAAP